MKFLITFVKGWVAGVNKNLEIIESEEHNKMSFVFFSLWTFILIARPQDYLLFLLPLRPAFLMSFLTLLAMIFEGIRFPKNFSQNREVRLIIFLYLIMIVGVPFAIHKRVAFDFVFKTLPKTLLYFFVLQILVRSAKRLNSIAFVAIVSALFSSLFYLKTALYAMGSRVYASEMYDPNDIAMVFVTYLPLSLYFLFSHGRFKNKLISLTAAFSMVIGIMLSQSRGGVLALAIVLFALLFLRTHGWKGSVKIATIAILSVISLYFFADVKNRFLNIKNDYNLTSEEGRLDIWKQNLKILSNHPVFGVGANCSAIALGFYRASKDGSQKWQVVHSSLIQLAVETGIPGFLVFLILNIGAVINLRKIRKNHDHVLSLLSSFLEICFYGFWAGALFLSHAYSIHLYFLLAMMATIRSINAHSDLNYEVIGEESTPSDLLMSAYLFRHFKRNMLPHQAWKSLMEEKSDQRQWSKSAFVR